jgi:molecular chaperone DnaJ
MSDRRFERRGADLWRKETLQVADAVLGTKLTVPTLAGEATVEVPPGTQPGSLLRLRGKGLPLFGQDRKGDLYLALGVHIPGRLSAGERELHDQLRNQTNTRRAEGSARKGRMQSTDPRTTHPTRRLRFIHGNRQC